MGSRILSCTIENILTGYITAWYGKYIALDHKVLRRVVQTAQYITGPELPSTRTSISGGVRHSSHPSHRLFTLLPSSKQYRSIGSQPNRPRDSFYPQAIRLLKSQTAK